jgi:hypothetical protein
MGTMGTAKRQIWMISFSPRAAPTTEPAFSNFSTVCLLYLFQDVSLTRFTEVSSLFVSLPKEVYPQVLFAVRRAVWRWIQIFPIEFAEALQQSRRQDSNAAQRLYDTLASKMDDTNRLFMWPALTALLIISNEKMQEAEGQQNGIYGKKKVIVLP